MIKVESFDSEKSKYIHKTIDTLISSHNTFGYITELFDNDVTIMKYFEAAREEVIESGNSSLGVMMVIALKNMAERLRNLEKETDDSDIEKLQFKIYKLESENRKLTARLNNITEVVNNSK